MNFYILLTPAITSVIDLVCTTCYVHQSRYQEKRKKEAIITRTHLKRNIGLRAPRNTAAAAVASTKNPFQRDRFSIRPLILNHCGLLVWKSGTFFFIFYYFCWFCTGFLLKATSLSADLIFIWLWYSCSSLWLGAQSSSSSSFLSSSPYHLPSEEAPWRQYAKV